MLHWLAGKPHETNNEDPDTTGCIDPPETPAHLFPVRALKHLVYGTPQTEKPKAPRRHSHTENGRSPQASRPRMTRPRSTNDATTMGRLGEAGALEPPASPTKGILMTPGTAGGKRKTVTFPDNVVDNEEKRPTKTGLPEDCPGKFPSPWTKSTTSGEHVEDSAQRMGGRSTKLTEALEQARDESSTRRKVRLGRPEKLQDDPDATLDLADPVSDSGKYWKREYDLYRERTTAEVKKLVAKQKLAKNYARDKDDECLDLTDELRQEKKKADKLQRRTEDLETQLKELQELLKKSKAAEQMAKDELEQIKRGLGTSGSRRPAETGTSAAFPSKTESEVKPWKGASASANGAMSGSEHQRNQGLQSATEQTERAKPRRRLRDLHSKHSTSTMEPAKPEPARPSSRDSRAVTSGTGATPLQTLSNNSSDMPKEALSLAISMGLQPRASPTIRDKRQDSPLQSTEPPLIHPDELSISLPSSPFHPDVTMDHTQPPSSPTVERSAAKKERQQRVAMGSQNNNNTNNNTKENIRPKSKDGGAEKPSAAWGAMSHVQLPPPVPVVSGENGSNNNNNNNNNNSINIKRLKALELARARLAARGRNVS